ncbi:MAG: hypothetical protein AMXMBFR57_16870 [Acidimicrobiia bacterium]
MSLQRSAHDRHIHSILTEIGAGRPLSQRSLARNLGIALGLTNLLLSRLVRKGLIRVSRVRPNRLAYFLTPKGMSEKAAMSRAYFQDSVRFYASARERVSAGLMAISRQWPMGEAAPVQKRVVFIGTGEVAEIAYVCLQETDLRLTGAIDFQGRKRFFGVPVHAAENLTADALRQLLPRGTFLVAFGDSQQSRAFLDRAGLSSSEVLWIQ